MSGGWQWYGAEGEAPEAYYIIEDTRDGAIAACRRDYPGRPFTIVEATKGDLRQWLPNADQIIEQTFERANDDGGFGEDGDGELSGSLDAIKAAEEDLNAALTAWFERHRGIFPTPWVFAEQRNQETFTPTAEEVAQAIEAEIAQLVEMTGQPEDVVRAQVEARR